MRRRVSWERRLSLACLAVGVLLLFVAAGIGLAEGSLVRPAYVSLIAGVALLISSVIIDARSALELVRDRRARFGALSLVVSAMVIGVLGLANVAASQSIGELDLTHGGLNTLSPESVKATRNLTADLQVIGFYRPDEKQDRNDATALLHLYQQQSPHVKVTMLDADQNAAEEQELGVTIPGSLALQYRNRPPVILTLASQTESDVTGALLRLESSHTPNLCWASGDGERAYSDPGDQNGYSQVEQLLVQRNYTVQQLLLSQQAQIPTSCDALAIVGPTTPLGAATQKAITSYLDGGGKLLLASGPWQSAGVTASLNAALDSYGVGFAGGLVVEPDPNHQAQGDPTTPAVFDWGASPISQDLSGKTVLFPHPTAITGAAGGNTVAVATSTDSAYEIAQPRDLAQSLGKESGDQAGPFTLMQSVDHTADNGRDTRIVLIGSPDFGEDLALGSGASNQDLTLGTFDWLTQQENLIAISPKSGPQALSVTQRELYLNGLVVLLLVPGAFAAIGALVLIRRRRFAAT